MRKFFVILLQLILIVSGGLLAIRFVVGSIHLPLLSLNSPVNAGGAAAVSFVLLALLTPGDTATAGGGRRRRDWIGLVALIVCTTAVFWRSLTVPFVFDDYTHILQASHASWRILYEVFQPLRGRLGMSFRPVTFILYWLDYHWAGSVAARWHAWSLAAHAANICLFFLLVRRLGLRRMGATLAAAVFALHGSRAETVAWSDARSDLLATLFCLCVLSAVLEYCRTGRHWILIPMMLCASFGVYTKESAFCLPLLPVTLLPLLTSGERRRALASSVALASVCVLLFAYRWWAIGGIGGYPDPSGVSTFWRSRPLHTSEALLFRQWAFLFFPVNWSVPPEWWLSLPAAGCIAALIAGARSGGVSRARLLSGIAFLLAAALPVEHLLMFQPDFAGARVLYLSVAGLAIFWGVLVDGAGGRMRWVTGLALIAFNIAALEHNLTPWRTSPLAAEGVCRALGNEMTRDPRPIIASGLPERRDGVYFLANGFPECVEMNSGQPMG